MRQIRCGVRPVTSRPASVTRPALGCRCPVIRLNSVDFPAPLGPMTAAISPCPTAKLTSRTATNPAKDLVSPSTSSTKAAPPEVAKARDGGGDTADDTAGEGKEQDQQ